MAWKRSDGLSGNRFRHHGLDKALAAGRVCHQAEQLYPNLFRAVSLANGVLHLEITKRNQLPLKMIEGKLLEDLQAFSTDQKLPTATRIRLTFQEE